MEKQKGTYIKTDGETFSCGDTDNFRLDGSGTDNFHLDVSSVDSFIVSGGQIQLTSMAYYDWQPEKDITTYELAKCVPIITAMQMMGAYYQNWEKVINDLPENCQRHFAKVEG